MGSIPLMAQSYQEINTKLLVRGVDLDPELEWMRCVKVVKDSTRTTMFAGTTLHVHRFDITDPEHPIFESEVVVGEWRGTQAWDLDYRRYDDGREVLFVTLSEDGFLVYDVTDPKNFVLLDSVYSDGFFNPMSGIRGDTLYSRANHVIVTIDISNPNNCRFVGRGHVKEGVSTDSHKSPVYFYEHYLVVPAESGFGYHFVDMSDPRNPVRIDSTDNTYNHPRTFLIADTLLFAVGHDKETNEVYLSIFDISDIRHFNLLSRIKYQTGNNTTIKLEGNYLFVGDWMLDIYDISDLTNPVKAGSFRELNVTGSDWWWDMEVVDNVAYIAGYVRGLAIVQFTGATPVEHPPTAAAFTLAPAFPNPVASGNAATVEFALPTSGYVTLTLCNTLGQELRRTEKRMEPGTHTERISTTGLNPGVYYYTLTAGGKRETEMLVVR